MKRFLTVIALSLILAFSSSLALGADGPLHIKNTLPLFIGDGSPGFEQARPEDSLGAHLTYSSAYIVKTGTGWSYMTDIEAAALELEIKKTIGDKTEVGLTVPIVSFNSGVLDSLLDSYHSAFGFADYGRGQRPEDDFLLDIKRNGEDVVDGHAGETALGDIRISLKRTVFERDDSTLASIYAYAELPTGDAEHGYGNGSFDWGIAALGTLPLGERFYTYGMAGAAFPGGLDAKTDADMRNFLFGGLGIGWKASEKTSVKAQIYAQGGPFERMGIRAVDTSSALFTIGAERRFGESYSVEASFSEDLNTAGQPDFSVGIGMKYYPKW